jgi:hypothetical protein
LQDGSGTIAKLAAGSSQFTLSGVTGANVKLSGLAAPTNLNDAVTKNYVDSINFGGASWLAPVEVATTEAGTLATSLRPRRQRIHAPRGSLLRTRQMLSLTASTSCRPPVRPCALPAGMSAGCSAVFAQRGTLNGNCSFVCATNDGVVGTDALAF